MQATSAVSIVRMVVLFMVSPLLRDSRIKMCKCRVSRCFQLGLCERQLGETVRHRLPCVEERALRVQHHEKAVAAGVVGLGGGGHGGFCFRQETVADL